MSSKGNLVLTRAPGTSLKIGEDIDITVLGFCDADGAVFLKGVSVKIAVCAPKHVRVVRDDAVSTIRRKPIGRLR